MHNTLRVGPRLELGRPRGERAPRGQPERELAGRMEVQRPAQRPRLDERAVAPQRLANVLLCDPVDARGKLQLSGRLHLRVDPADVVSDLQEIGRAPREGGTRETPRANLVPGH